MAQLIIKLDIARPGFTLMEKLRSVDWIGGALFIGSVCSLLIGITWGGIEHPWASAPTLVPIVMGVLGLAVTIYWEVAFTSQPFLRLNLFGTMTAKATYAMSFLQGSIVSIPITCSSSDRITEADDRLLARCSPTSTTFPSTLRPAKMNPLLQPA
jgi:hypothetical protein